jgi:hypothetical protein
MNDSGLVVTTAGSADGAPSGSSELVHTWSSTTTILLSLNFFYHPPSLLFWSNNRVRIFIFYRITSVSQEQSNGYRSLTNKQKKIWSSPLILLSSFCTYFIYTMVYFSFSPQPLHRPQGKPFFLSSRVSQTKSIFNSLFFFMFCFNEDQRIQKKVQPAQRSLCPSFSAHPLTGNFLILFFSAFMLKGFFLSLFFFIRPFSISTKKYFTHRPSLFR